MYVQRKFLEDSLHPEKKRTRTRRRKRRLGESSSEEEERRQTDFEKLKKLQEKMERELMRANEKQRKTVKMVHEFVMQKNTVISLDRKDDRGYEVLSISDCENLSKSELDFELIDKFYKEL